MKTFRIFDRNAIVAFFFFKSFLNLRVAIPIVCRGDIEKKEKRLSKSLLSSYIWKFVLCFELIHSFVCYFVYDIYREKFIYRKIDKCDFLDVSNNRCFLFFFFHFLFFVTKIINRRSRRIDVILFSYLATILDNNSHFFFFFYIMNSTKYLQYFN